MTARRHAFRNVCALLAVGATFNAMATGEGFAAAVLALLAYCVLAPLLD